MERKQTALRARFAVLVMALALVLAACGTETSEETDTSEDIAAATDNGPTAGETDATETEESDEPVESSEEPVVVGVVASFSGAAALAGTKFRAGIEMATEEINAAGGILGHPVELITEDAQTEPTSSVAAMRRVLGQDPIAIMGTVFSGLTVVNMDTVNEARIPQFTASESNDVYSAGLDHIFPTSHRAGLVAQRSRDFVLEFEPETAVLAYANTEFGVSNAESVRDLFNELGIELVEDISVDNLATDFTGEAATIERAGADMVYLVMHEESGGRIMTALANTNVPETADILGNVVMLSGDVRELAGDAANGIYGLIGEIETADAFRDVGERFVEANPGELPDNNLYKGYTGMHALAAGFAELGEIDPEAFLGFMRDRTLCVEDYPGILLSTHWEENGDMDRQMYVVQIVDGVPEVSEILPPRNPDAFADCERME